MNTTIFETLKEEHDRILTFCGYVRNTCANCIESQSVHVAEFRSMVQFIRDYADGHHHRKEEKILFQEMLDRLGSVAVNLVVLFALNTTVPAFAEDTAEKKTPYTIEYSKVEQTVLGNNLQVNSNMLSLDSLDNKNELKKKYENILD
ncbi:MAG: hemerythrin domain-containing protein, partial [Oscillospiraceae bacterium]|nr:hemerythrin domain-containing protein [Oscillospiraceae bacterium]